MPVLIARKYFSPISQLLFAFAVKDQASAVPSNDNARVRSESLWRRDQRINMKLFSPLFFSFSNCRPLVCAAFSLAVLTFSLPAVASLGGHADSIQADTAHMSSSVNQSSGDNYEIHQLQSPAGTVVNEYLSSSGTVFAVTWHGPFMPDMQQILGTYFQQYSSALSSQPRQYGHRPLNIQQPGIVVQTSGHMRAHWGRVYVPALVPDGVNAEQLQ